MFLKGLQLFESDGENDVEEDCDGQKAKIRVKYFNFLILKGSDFSTIQYMIQFDYKRPF